MKDLTDRKEIKRRREKLKIKIVSKIKNRSKKKNVLNEISKDIEKRFYIRFVETTNADDRDIFYDYTIRMLPTIIILGSKNNIIKRFSPGIQSKDIILNAIQEL